MRPSDRSGHPVGVTETTELRWFADGVPPEAVMSWFTSDGRRGDLEVRCDLYLVDSHADVGVKLRGHETLELKVRRAVTDSWAWAAGPAGRIEVWHKWSPADALVDVPTDQPWVEVRKRIVRRRFTVGGGDVARAGAERSMAGAGCDVEITAVQVAGVASWSFAFAAFGALADQQTSIATAWRALGTDGSPLTDLTVSCGYPAWIGRHVGPPRSPHTGTDGVR